MAYPAAAGLILHVGDRVAVRPDLSFSNTSLQTTPSGTTQHSSTIGAGISALFYLTRWEALRAYVSPRYGYSYTWGTSSIVTNSTSHSSSTAITGSFGAQYALGDRFSVFAETGVGYNTTKNTIESASLLAAINNKMHGWATRSGLGAILYF
jgi:outer membrane protein with beta-barrel domain